MVTVRSTTVPAGMVAPLLQELRKWVVSEAYVVVAPFSSEMVLKSAASEQPAAWLVAGATKRAAVVATPSRAARMRRPSAGRGWSDSAGRSGRVSDMECRAFRLAPA